MTPSERAAAIAAKARIAEQERAADLADKTKNRELMPQSAAFIDAFSAVFGKLPYGRFTENGRTVTWGKKRCA